MPLLEGHQIDSNRTDFVHTAHKNKQALAILTTIYVYDSDKLQSHSLLQLPTASTTHGLLAKHSGKSVIQSKIHPLRQLSLVLGTHNFGSTAQACTCAVVWSVCELDSSAVRALAVMRSSRSSLSCAQGHNAVGTCIAFKATWPNS